MMSEVNSYRVALPIYQGPLDLLLFLIRKEEMDIYDIPIARITGQYIEYVDFMQELNLAVAGDFFVMSATLMEIKSAMLLPRGSVDEDDEIEDPRLELVEKLLEYKKYRNAAGELAELESEQAMKFPAGGSVIRRNGDEEKEPENAFILLTALKDVLERYSEPDFIIPAAEGPTLDEQIEYIRGELAAKKGQVRFEALLHTSRIFIIVTFLALLELLKRGEIRVLQEIAFDEIYIQSAERN
ncbi:MAG: segregation/condensation protein A [bacterium]|nr:segregation/condensation protein A [bacterium]